MRIQQDTILLQFKLSVMWKTWKKSIILWAIIHIYPYVTLISINLRGFTGKIRFVYLFCCSEKLSWKKQWSNLCCASIVSFFHFSQFIFFLTVFERFACLCWHLPASKHIVHNNFFPSGCEHNVLLFLLYDAVDAVIFALFLFLFYCCCCDRIRCVVWWWQCLFLEWSVDYMYIYNESSFIANIVNCCI